jgi:hypothetical protein
VLLWQFLWVVERRIGARNSYARLAPDFISDAILNTANVQGFTWH